MSKKIYLIIGIIIFILIIGSYFQITSSNSKFAKSDVYE